MSVRRAAIILISCAALFLGSSVLDGAAVNAFQRDDVYSSDWARTLRILGYVPVWLAVALAFVLIDAGQKRPLGWPLRDMWTRGVLLILAAGSAGIVAELLKLLLRRERPSDVFNAYTFRPWGVDTWSTSGLGLPSSHVAVAGGALVMLCLLYKRAAPVFLLGALGCAFTRVLAGAHFVSDAMAGLLVGALCALAWWRLHLRNLRAHAAESPSDRVDA